MPVYSYQLGKSKPFDMVMTIDEMEEFEASNPGLKRIFKSVRLSYSGDGISSKMDGDFKSRLKEIKKTFPRSTINTFN